MIQQEPCSIEKKTKKQRIADYILITIASAIYAVGVSMFLDPNNLASGGVTGIAIILNRFTGIETGTMFLILNIPIILLGFWKFGLKFIISTFYSIFMVSIFTNLFAPFGAATTDQFLAAMAGSALVAVGIGLIFKAGSTSGGVDIIVKCLRIRYPHLKSGALFLILDMAIVVAAGIVFRDLDTALYAGLAVIICSAVLDVVLYGRDEAKLIYIISNRFTKIADRLMEEVDVGVTYIKGQGAYSNTDKQVIMCVIKKQSAPRVEVIVKEEDADAFMIVSSASEIFGEGYKSYFSEKL
ncbi:MAG: YitT family protein [Lachnospiraceae bacterium]